MRKFAFSVSLVFWAAVPMASGHPHQPHPLGAPEKGTISTAKQAAAIPGEAQVAIVDGSHRPGEAVEILRALARKPNLRELQIYGATKWAGDALAPLEGFKHLQVLRIFDDSTRRKPECLRAIAKVPSLQILQLYLSGD